MAKKVKKKNAKNGKAGASQNKSDPLAPAFGPWISMRTGIRLIAVASIGMAVLTTYQALQQQMPALRAVLTGLFFGALVWLVFFGMYWVNRKLH